MLMQGQVTTIVLLKKSKRVQDVFSMAKEVAPSNGHKRTTNGSATSKKSHDDKAGPSSRRNSKDKKTAKIIHTLNVADKNKTNNKSSAAPKESDLKTTPVKIILARESKLRAHRESVVTAPEVTEAEKKKLEKLGYILSNSIGKDPVCTKFRAHWLEDKKECALRQKHHLWCKVVDSNVGLALDDLKNRELKLLLKLAHPNIVNLHSLLHFNDKIYVFTSGGMNGSVMNFLASYGPLKELHSRVWFRQLLNGLEYLHSKNIFHGDINCETLLLKDHYDLVISDFGRANYAERDSVEKLNANVNKSLYSAPEVLLGDVRNGKMADLWSVGVVLFSFFMGYPPFRYYGENDEQIAKLVVDQIQMVWYIDIGKKLSLNAWKVVCALLEPDVLKRANINFLKQSQFYSMKECVCGHGSFKRLSVDILSQLPDLYSRKNPPKSKVEIKNSKVVCPVFKEFFNPKRDLSLKIEDAEQTQQHIVINLDDCTPHNIS